MFTNQYTGFDALFIDHFTNTRYTLDQEVEADLLALRLMHEIGFFTAGNFNKEVYRNILKLIQEGEIKPEHVTKTKIDFS